MLQSEGLHVRHALQTVSALEAVVVRSFGPDGGQVLFTRDTGHVLLTRHGTRILTALRLEHPLARMVVECVWKHSSATGEGSKTFVLLLASLLRRIHSHASSGAGTGAAARRLAEELLAFASEELADVIVVGVVPYCSSLSPRNEATNAPVLHSLVGGFLRTRLGHAHSDAINRLACELLSQWACPDGLLSPALRFVDANFPALHTAVSGFPIGCSRLLEGQVIHRDFSTPHPPADRQPIRALAVTEPLHPDVLTDGAVLELDGGGGGRCGVGGAFIWAQRRLERAFVALQGLGVTLLLSSAKQSDATLASARRAGVCVVECVPEDEISLCCRLGGAEPVSDWSLIGQRNVADLTFCRPILLGGHRYVHMGFPGSANRGEFRPHSVVLCGPGEGQTEQSAAALRDALRMLLATLEPTDRTDAAARGGTFHTHAAGTADKTAQPLTEQDPSEEGVFGPGRVITVGGTFEWLLHRALLQRAGSAHQSHTDTSSPALLAEALLSVPRQIYSRSPRCYLQAQTRLLRCLHDGSGSPSARVESGSAESCALESVVCKHRLILAVLQCARSLLRADSVLHTRAPSRARSHRHSDTPRHDSEEEEEEEEEEKEEEED